MSTIIRVTVYKNNEYGLFITVFYESGRTRNYAQANKIPESVFKFCELHDRLNYKNRIDWI